MIILFNRKFVSLLLLKSCPTQLNSLFSFECIFIKGGKTRFYNSKKINVSSMKHQFITNHSKDAKTEFYRFDLPKLLEFSMVRSFLWLHYMKTDKLNNSKVLIFDKNNLITG